MNRIYLSLRELILPLKEINSAIDKNGTIVDLGCGQGQIATYLAQVKSRNVLGVDKNTKRIQKNYQNNLKFKVGDITKINLGKINGAVISDVLHHIPKKDQKILIQKVSGSLIQKGTFVIKEIDTGEFLRSRLSRLWDFVLYPKDKINYWKKDDLVKYLKEVGFKSIKVTRPCRFFPGSTTLYVCKK